jgi:hypothetical protein
LEKSPGATPSPPPKLGKPAPGRGSQGCSYPGVPGVLPPKSGSWTRLWGLPPQTGGVSPKSENQEFALFALLRKSTKTANSLVSKFCDFSSKLTKSAKKVRTFATLCRLGTLKSHRFYRVPPVSWKNSCFRDLLYTGKVAKTSKKVDFLQFSGFSKKSLFGGPGGVLFVLFALLRKLEKVKISHFFQFCTFCKKLSFSTFCTFPVSSPTVKFDKVWSKLGSGTQGLGVLPPQPRVPRFRPPPHPPRFRVPTEVGGD